MSIDQVDYIRIFPGIGIMRVGNSTSTEAAPNNGYFIGPEAPGVVPDPGGGKYKDASGRVKRQAARFRIYGYKKGQPDPVMEITSDDAHITWTVEMRNMKAANYAFQGKYAFDAGDLRNSNIQPGLAPQDRDQLIIAPPARSISGNSVGPINLAGSIFKNVGPNGDGTGLALPGELEFEGSAPSSASNPPPVPVTYRGVDNIVIGILRTDEKGRLVLLPGAGKSESVTMPKVNISKVQTVPPKSNPEINGNSYFNNPGWYDDTGGGRVTATVNAPGGKTFHSSDNTTADGQKNGDAWVVSTPTKYAPASMPVVSLYDVMLNLFPDADPNNGKKCNFYRDIYPRLAAVVDYAWLNLAAFYSGEGRGHGPNFNSLGDLLSPLMINHLSDPSDNGKAVRNQVFGLIRKPWESQPEAAKYDPCQPWESATAKTTPVTTTTNEMPLLYGDGGSPEENKFNGTNYPQQWLTLSPHQYAKFKVWSQGDFDKGTPPTAAPPFDDIPLAQQPHALDQSALETCVGGGFHPGIELTYNMQCAATFDAAFRIKAGTVPGSISAYMSIPWQGDFWSCNTHWWPGNRPDIWVDWAPAPTPNAGTQTPYEWFSGKGVPPQDQPGYQAMVTVWSLLGFVVPSPDAAPVWGQRVLGQVERDGSLGPGAAAPPPTGSTTSRQTIQGF